MLQIFDNLFHYKNQITLTIHEKLKLFDSLVGSILNYASEIWGYHEAPDIEHIHTKFLRKILGVRKSTNLEALYGKTGRYPMKIVRKMKVINYWIKLLRRRNSLEFYIYGTRTCNPHVLDTWLLNEASLSKIKKTCLS